MPSIHCDALVLGSTLGGLVAGSFLARAGLRVVLIEEEIHQKRPSLLREPFLLTGLERGGPVGELLGDLGIPLLERREIAPREIALQVLLPGGARIDVGRGRRVLSSELDLYGVVDRATALIWLGIILFSAFVLFTLVTLPVEFDASRRAIASLGDAGVLSGPELDGASTVLRAAAMTYVAAAISAIIQLLYFVWRAGLLGGNNR